MGLAERVAELEAENASLRADDAVRTWAYEARVAELEAALATQDELADCAFR